MVQLTDRASAELERLRVAYVARSHQGVRLRETPEGALGIGIDVPHAGDSVIRRDYVPLLIVDARLAARLAPRILDFRAEREGGRGFTLGWRTASSTEPSAAMLDTP